MYIYVYLYYFFEQILILFISKALFPSYIGPIDALYLELKYEYNDNRFNELENKCFKDLGLK